jgi:hypothetical protein
MFQTRISAIHWAGQVALPPLTSHSVKEGIVKVSELLRKQGFHVCSLSIDEQQKSGFDTS